MFADIISSNVRPKVSDLNQYPSLVLQGIFACTSYDPAHGRRVKIRIPAFPHTRIPAFAPTAVKI